MTTVTTATIGATGTRALAEFAAELRYDDIPAHVIEGAKDLMVDWLGSALAGKGARPVVALEQFAVEMGPRDGPSEIIPSRGATSPLFAALINGAASHVAEQDDVHNGAVFHPATVVFPAVLAVAQAERASGRELLAAAIAGYEVGIRVGEFLGRSHYKIFHTTGTAGTIASAAAVARLLDLDADATQHAIGSAGTQAAGLWEFLRDAADSKQLAHRQGGGRRSSLGVSRPIGRDRRAANSRGCARPRRRHVPRRRSVQADRPTRRSLGDD